MDCDALYVRAEETWAVHNTEGDYVLNHGDFLTEENKDWLFTVSDTDMAGNVPMCELFDCVVYVENQWRLDNCPLYTP
jgi:hypothetical protein